MCYEHSESYRVKSLEIPEPIVQIIDDDPFADFGDAVEHVVDVGTQDVLGGGDAGGTRGGNVGCAENGQEEEEDDYDDEDGAGAGAAKFETRNSKTNRLVTSDERSGGRAFVGWSISIVIRSIEFLHFNLKHVLIPRPVLHLIIRVVHLDQDANHGRHVVVPGGDVAGGIGGVD